MKHKDINWNDPNVQQFLQHNMGDLIEMGHATVDLSGGIKLTAKGKAWVDQHIFKVTNHDNTPA